jgi:putative FmdB family regulatory protein
MPTYEYACSKCGRQFEKIQSIKAKALTVCPRDVCPRKPWGKGKVARRISAGGGLIFKGSGFYTTDYRSESYKAAAKKDNPAPAKPEAAKAETAKETKPAPSSDSGGAKPAGASSSPAKDKS